MANKLLNNNLFKRILTALVLIPIVVYIVIEGGFLFDSFLGLVFIIATYEVIKIVNNDKKISLLKKLMWIIPILIYIGLSIYCLKSAINNSAGGVSPFFLLLSIWIFDTAAYLVGSIIGGPKLCPKISPKKTCAGLFGGMIITFISPAIFFICGGLIKDNFTLDFSNFMSETIGYWIAFGFVAMFSGTLGQIGDLLESWFKRKFGVKDSGNILPGHGGVLDRMDSIFLASYFWYFLNCM